MTKVWLASLRQSSGEYKRFVGSKGDIYSYNPTCWMLHIGSGAFEVQYASQWGQIFAGMELGPALGVCARVCVVVCRVPGGYVSLSPLAH